MFYFSAEKPVYIQIADWLEDEIIGGGLKTGDRAFSQNELSAFFKVNPATAAKGLSLLTERGILEKQRGLGLFVTEGAAQRIISERKTKALAEKVGALIEECKKLGIGPEELSDKIKREWR